MDCVINFVWELIIYSFVALISMYCAAWIQHVLVPSSTHCLPSRQEPLGIIIMPTVGEKRTVEMSSPSSPVGRKKKKRKDPLVIEGLENIVWGSLLPKAPNSNQSVDSAALALSSMTQEDTRKAGTIIQDLSLTYLYRNFTIEITEFEEVLIFKNIYTFLHEPSRRGCFGVLVDVGGSVTLFWNPKSTSNVLYYLKEWNVYETLNLNFLFRLNCRLVGFAKCVNHRNVLPLEFRKKIFGKKLSVEYWQGKNFILFSDLKLIESLESNRDCCSVFKLLKVRFKLDFSALVAICMLNIPDREVEALIFQSVMRASVFLLILRDLSRCLRIHLCVGKNQYQVFNQVSRCFAKRPAYVLIPDRRSKCRLVLLRTFQQRRQVKVVCLSEYDDFCI